MISRLHYITQDLAHIPHWEQAQRACEGGADWVQLRVKTQEESQWLETALRTQEVCKSFGAKLIVNDNPHIAAKIQSEGLHLGKQDMSPLEARQIVGEKMIIGGTANTLQDMLKHVASGTVQYIGLGPLRFTDTKKKLSPIVGLEGYKRILTQFRTLGHNLPVVGIGGVKADDIEDLLAAGLHGVAVSSLINIAENPSAVTQELLGMLNLTVSAK